MTMIAPINKIIDHSVVDGPGNRTAIFFQGCNFNCSYCHNPETIQVCSQCGICVPACPSQALAMKEGKAEDKIEGKVVWNHAKCIGCDACIAACPHDSSPKVLFLTPEEVAARVAENRPFIRGVTCSGGECTLYPQFLTRLFTLTKEMGLENLLDSNGSYDYLADPALLAVTDGVMLDIKAFDEAAHRALTGCGNALVLENAVRLARIGKLPEVRTVIVPGVLPNAETIHGVCGLLAPYLTIAPIRYKLLRYRPLGVRAEFRDWPTPTTELMEELREIVLSYGFADAVIL